MPRPREFDIDTVLSQSMHVFWAQGYKATSMEDLMKATQLNKQSFYCAFGDKHSLFIKTLALYRQRSSDAFRDALSQPGSPFQTIERLMLSIFSGKDDESCPMGCFIVNTTLEFGEDDPAVANEIKAMSLTFERLLDKALQRGQAAGEITTRFESLMMAKGLVCTMSGLRVMQKHGETIPTMIALMQMYLACLRV